MIGRKKIETDLHKKLARYNFKQFGEVKEIDVEGIKEEDSRISVG